MAYTKQEVQDWVKKLDLNTWGPTEVYWSDSFHRVHVIAADMESAAVTECIMETFIYDYQATTQTATHKPNH